MQALFETGRIIDLILLVFAAEAVIAIVYLRRTGRPVLGLVANLAAGACLLVAIRDALTGAGWHWVAIWIGLSLPFHLIDLGLRAMSQRGRAADSSETGRLPPRWLRRA